MAHQFHIWEPLLKSNLINFISTKWEGIRWNKEYNFKKILKYMFFRITVDYQSEYSKIKYLHSTQGRVRPEEHWVGDWD